MNELDLIKLNIFEAYDNGEITYGEKEYLLEQVGCMYEATREQKEFNKKVNKWYNNDEKFKKFLKDNNITNKSIASEIENNPNRKMRGNPTWEEFKDKLEEKNLKLANEINQSYKDMKNARQGRDIHFVPSSLRRSDDKHPNRCWDDIDTYKDKYGCTTYHTGIVDSFENQLRSTSNNIKNRRAELKKKPKLTERQQKIQELKKKHGFTESTFDYLLESINDLYYED